MCSFGNAHEGVRTREVPAQPARLAKENIFEVIKLIVIISEMFITNKCSPNFPETFITLLCILSVHQLLLGTAMHML